MANAPSAQVEPASPVEAETMRKVMWRLLPFLMLCYFIAYVDRVNAGFAALTMNRDVGLTQAVFGIGGGLFFVAYVLFEVPSNLALEKVGARLWIARIMTTWGRGGLARACRYLRFHRLAVAFHNRSAAGDTARRCHLCCPAEPSRRGQMAVA